MTYTEGNGILSSYSAQFKLGPDFFSHMSATGTSDSTTTSGTFTTGGMFDFNTVPPAGPVATDAWQAEWKKFRSEFIRKLLTDKPEGIFSFRQERDIKHPNSVRVKLIIEYEPDYDKEGKARR